MTTSRIRFGSRILFAFPILATHVADRPFKGDFVDRRGVFVAGLGGSISTQRAAISVVDQTQDDIQIAIEDSMRTRSIRLVRQMFGNMFQTMPFLAPTRIDQARWRPIAFAANRR